MRHRFMAIAFLISTSSAQALEYPSFEVLYTELKAALIKACDGKSDCIRRTTSLAWFLWKNRDKADIEYQAMKCLGYSAVKRGYVWNPTTVLTDMTPESAQQIAMEVCECTLGYWAQEKVCSQIGDAANEYLDEPAPTP